MQCSRTVKSGLWIGVFFGIIFSVMFGTQAAGYHVAARITQGIQSETMTGNRNILLGFAAASLSMSVLDGYALSTLRKARRRDETKA